jgi:hypothetical protein
LTPQNASSSTGVGGISGADLGNYIPWKAGNYYLKRSACINIYSSHRLYLANQLETLNFAMSISSGTLLRSSAGLSDGGSGSNSGHLDIHIAILSPPTR